MYTYTNPNDSPLLVTECKCGRQFIQQQIYTCLNCQQYACRYCTQIELHTYYCRSCSDIVSQSECTKLYRCQKCYSCPVCTHVLSMTKDPKLKKYVLLCQFCYWNSKDIGVSDEKPEELLKIVEKLSRGIKDSEVRAYQACQKYFKDHLAESQRIKDVSRRRISTVSIDSKISSTKAIEQEPIKSTTLLDESMDEERRERPVPKGIPLLSRKTRRCLNCKKLLTKSFKTFKNEHKVQLGHSEPKILLCQKTQPIEKILMKSLVDMKFKIGDAEKLHKAGEIIEVKLTEVPFKFSVLAEFAIPNKDKKAVTYNMVLYLKK